HAIAIARNSHAVSTMSRLLVGWLAAFFAAPPLAGRPFCPVRPVCPEGPPDTRGAPAASAGARAGAALGRTRAARAASAGRPRAPRAAPRSPAPGAARRWGREYYVGRLVVVVVTAAGARPPAPRARRAPGPRGSHIPKRNQYPSFAQGHRCPACRHKPGL